MKFIIGLPFALLLGTSSALAQTQPAEPPMQPAAPAPAPVPAPAPAPVPYQPGPTYQPVAPGPSQAPEVRSGFTAMLSIGYGLTTFSPDEGEGETEGGLAGLNIDLGTYINPDFAVFVTIGGTSFTIESPVGDLDFINGFFGLIGQFRVTPELALGGGAGLGYFALTSNSDTDPETGLAITGRASYRFVGSWQGMLSLTPSFYDGATVTSTSFLVAYQWD